jgi:hypothetical protein
MTTLEGYRAGLGMCVQPNAGPDSIAHSIADNTSAHIFLAYIEVQTLTAMHRLVGADLFL